MIPCLVDLFLGTENISESHYTERYNATIALQTIDQHPSMSQD